VEKTTEKKCLHYWKILGLQFGDPLVTYEPLFYGSPPNLFSSNKCLNLRGLEGASLGFEAFKVKPKKQAAERYSLHLITYDAVRVVE
jgi:hypothetical protein